MDVIRTAVAVVAAIDRPNRTDLVTRDGYLCQVRLAGKEKVAMLRNAVTSTVGVLLLLLLWPPSPVVAQKQSPLQVRVTGSCAEGSSIRVINTDGSVVCQVDTGAGVTSVTASSPLGSSGGTTPNISLSHFIIETEPGENTAIGVSALSSNTTGRLNTATGLGALSSNTTGLRNTATGYYALASNTTGSGNTAIGFGAGVTSNDLSNATAIGAAALVDASNKVRIGSTDVTVIEGQVAFTFPSDKSQKENFQPVDGEDVLRKIRGFNLASWNYIGHDPKEFRHYGPVAQEFFAAFGHDGIGTAGSPTTINSGDVAGILMSAVQELSKQNLELKARLDSLERLVTSDHTGRVLSVVEK